MKIQIYVWKKKMKKKLVRMNLKFFQVFTLVLKL